MTRPDTPLPQADRHARRAPPAPALAAQAAADDAELVARCIAGDATAWTALVQRYQRLVYAIVGRMGLDQHAAADVFQTVFSRLLQHLPRIADPSRLQAWIVTTAKRESLLQRKLVQRSVSISRDDDADGDAAGEWDWADESPIAEEALADLQQLHQLREAMSRLDERSRRVLQLLFREDGEALPYEEVARQLGIPVGSIGPTRARCLEKLRRLVTAL